MACSGARLMPQDHNLTIMLSIGLRSRSPSQDCQGFQVLQTHQGPSMQMASRATIPSLTAPRTPTPSQGYHQIDSGAISREAITHAYYMIRGAFSLICALDHTERRSNSFIADDSRNDQMIFLALSKGSLSCQRRCCGF